MQTSTGKENSATSLENASGIDKKVIESHLNASLEVYKHHFDLFLKFNALYLAAVGAMAGYMFTPPATPSVRQSLAFMIAVASVVGFFGNAVARFWLRDLKKTCTHALLSIGNSFISIFGCFGHYADHGNRNKPDLRRGSLALLSCDTLTLSGATRLVSSLTNK